MAIKSGRNGDVKWDPTGGATTVSIISLNNWKLSLKTDKIDVTCFGDQNKVYVPGMKDISGSVAGFWNSSELALFEATDATVPGMLELIPDTTDAAATTMLFKGLAYLDADIDTDVQGAPAVTGTILAAGPWTLPSAV
jgi:hypothetical protein